MSKVKTRKEINEEMQALAGEISALRESHAEEVKGFESTIELQAQSISALENEVSEKVAELETAQQVIVDADAKIEAIQNEYKEQTESLTAEIEAKTEALAESESGFAKAKAALQNPAFADASIVPCKIDQKHEDAEADAQEKQTVESDEDKTCLEIYNGMPRGQERLDYYNANKQQIEKDLASQE